MTKERERQQAGPELDALALVWVLGWRWQPYELSDGTGVELLWHARLGTPRGDDFRPLDATRMMPWDAPRPSTDFVAAGELEEEIERRRLQYPYTLALGAIVMGTREREPGIDETWKLLRATPQQRCRAALRAVGFGNDSGREPPSDAWPGRSLGARPWPSRARG